MLKKEQLMKLKKEELADMLIANNQFSEEQFDAKYGEHYIDQPRAGTLNKTVQVMGSMTKLEIAMAYVVTKKELEYTKITVNSLSDDLNEQLNDIDEINAENTRLINRIALARKHMELCSMLLTDEAIL